ncbi:MAG: hypothetical protein H6656_01070 [Ardenticatenaceae bacterium]|nr:hypothetical protein [Anaerolineales bacterium]MCB9005977.1 hypothetical protein [Ardenticatenaceae bacterium]
MSLAAVDAVFSAVVRLELVVANGRCFLFGPPTLPGTAVWQAYRAVALRWNIHGGWFGLSL